ncbi:facilitated trehalose transporter Tret1-like isoform X2 [Leptidea sinapis]|uniref:facilitated trehalose transporter Tret1-like isoform X2 n=1 Tax=Leptidea sinapis TaxID=189913 RepID=UPI0021C2A512|nr:facilitated trehalose transporter Tret1-like isoform X2 [Leptidea sinapis]
MTDKDKFSPLVKQCFVTAAICSNIIGHGCSFGYPAILLPKLLANDSVIPITKSEASWIAGTLSLTMLMAYFITTPLMDSLGRRYTHIILTIPAIAGWLVIVMATTVSEIIIGRILNGISIGMLFTLRSALIGEYTSPQYRGGLLTTASLSQAFGIFFVHLLGSFTSWQRTALICVFFHFISLLMIIYSPESPSWFLAKGRYDECRDVFKWLRGNKEDNELEHMIQAQTELKKLNNEIPKYSIRTCIETLKKNEFYKPIVLMSHCNIILQFSGGTTMAAYATVILSHILGEGANVSFWMVFLDTQRIIFNTVAVFVLNKFKRRTMMFLTIGVCIFSHIAIATYVLSTTLGWMSTSIWLPALLINIQFITVAVGTVPLPIIVTGEVFPLKYKDLTYNLGFYGTYYLYALIMSFNLIMVWFLLPETKGKTLQEIEDEFRGQKLRLYDQHPKNLKHSRSLIDLEGKLICDSKT